MNTGLGFAKLSVTSKALLRNIYYNNMQFIKSCTRSKFRPDVEELF